MDLNKLETSLKSYPAYRLKQAYQAVFLHSIESWDQASSLPKNLKELLKKECPLTIPAEIIFSKDKKTAKAAITLTDGNVIETVLLRHNDGRNTICVSCGIGCNLACEFCATGQQGFKRHLTSQEIILQIILFNRLLKNEKQKITNVVFMGMGEPFLNYDEVIKAIKIINDKDRFNIGARHISISTVGIMEGIKRLADENLQVNLAISIHAPSNRLRHQLMPINQQYPLTKLLKTVAAYLAKTKRQVMIEYLMLQDINDSPKQAEELAHLLKKNLPGLFFVNLISYNQTEKFKPTSPEKIKKFKDILLKEGIKAVQRYHFGSDIKAACGQLANQKK